MLIKQIIDFNWEDRASWPNIYSYNWLFHNKTKISKENLRVDYYFLLKCSQSQSTLLPPTRSKSLTIKV